MEQFSTWQLDAVTRSLALAAALVLCGVLLLSRRAPLLARLGVRNIARRKLRAALIVFGLTLSTTVIGAALGTGDTMTHTIHTLVAGGLGAVDEVIVRDPPRAGFRERLRMLSEPGYAGLAAARLDLFSEEQAARVHTAARESSVIAGVLPALLDQVSVVHKPSRRLHTETPLLALAGSAAEGAPTTLDGLHTTAGLPLVLADLEDDQVAINQAAAESFGAGPGDPLTIIRGSSQWEMRVAAVVRNGGLAGTNPLVLLPLERYQRLLQRDGTINLFLVVNRGGVESIRHAEQATSDLRNALADASAAQELHAIFSRDELQRALVQLEGAVAGTDRDALVALRLAAAQPELTPGFVSELSEPRLRQRLLSLAWRLPQDDAHSDIRRLLQTLTELSVINIKHQSLLQARQAGAVITTVFLVLGLFSIAASLLLIFLVFALLAADRSTELATMRALGMRRRQILQIFLFEGAVYNVAGSALGTLASLFVTYAISSMLEQQLAPFGLRLVQHVEPGTLLITFASGILLTSISMYIAGWQVSRMQIIAATRGEAIGETQRWLVLTGALLLLLAGATWWRWHDPARAYVARHPLVNPGTLSLVIAGICCWLVALQRHRAGRSGEQVAGGLATLAGVALAALWLRTLSNVAGPGGYLREEALTIVAGILCLILVGVWTTARLLGPTARLLEHTFTALPTLRAVVRPAAGYLSSERWRSGLTLLLFSMVICAIVAALTMVHALLSAFADREPAVAGYDLRAELRGTSPSPSLAQVLEQTPTISRDSFALIGSVAPQEIWSIQTGVAQSRWQETRLVVADEQFLRGIKASFARRAPGYGTDQALWSALAQQPGHAVVTGRELQQVASIGAVDNTQSMRPLTLWIRSPSGGRPVKLSIIGVIDADSELDSGIYVSQATAEQLGVTLEAPQTYYLALKPGVRVKDALAGLRLALGDQGYVFSDLGNLLRITQSIRLLLTRLVQSFMGLGLIAGVAALGLVGVQAVHERRQQLGTLRALGLSRRRTQAALALEITIIAAFAVGLGVTLGLILAHSVVQMLAARSSDVLFVIPQREILVVVGAALLGSYAAVALAAVQAGRVAPAEALRHR